MKNTISSQFRYGKYSYHYELLRHDRRTLSLTVYPDLQLLVKCPSSADVTRINDFLERKWYWMQRQLHYFHSHYTVKHPKEYITGESTYYLGRQYQIHVIKESAQRVLVEKNKITLSTSDSKHAKSLLDLWYLEQTKRVITKRYQAVCKKLQVKSPPLLYFKPMRKRWGSYTKSGKILLNPRLIHTPQYCIDYVITHELCHIENKNHDAKYYKLLTKKLPNWQKIKDKLEYYGTII